MKNDKRLFQGQGLNITEFLGTRLVVNVADTMASRLRCFRVWHRGSNLGWDTKHTITFLFLLVF